MSTDTEHICEVVRVTGTSPHPGADRLELATFETKDGPSAYQVITGKGNLKPGDLAVYIGVDCVVPKGNAAFDFLFERLDGKGKDKFRVKAARIRGMYSEGLLMPPDDFGKSLSVWPGAFGHDCGEALGITYYVAPVKGTAFPVAGVPGTPKDASWGGVFPVYTVDSLRKVPFLFEQDETVVFTEKIHGTNFRAGYVKGKFLLGSHRTIKTDVRPWWRKLWARIRGETAKGEGYYGEDLWAAAAKEYSLEEKLRGFAPGVVVYGEIFGLTKGGAKVQDLTYGGPTLGLRLFDAYDTKAKEWLSFDRLVTLCGVLGVPMVPVLLTGRYSLDITKQVAEGVTHVGLDTKQIREGVVVRCLEGGPKRRGKWVSEAYHMRKGG
jgi:RNA ligase (TIGR02306 family)